MHRTLASILGALLLVLVLAVGVRADSQPTTLYACVNNSSGTIHMVSAADSCASNEQLVVWNQQGPTGPQGPQGAQGAAGTNGASGYQVVSTTTPLVSSSTLYHSLTVDCPSGKHVLGGGYAFTAGTVFAPYPVFTTYVDGPMGSDGIAGDGWTYAADVPLGAGTQSALTVYAICATV